MNDHQQVAGFILSKIRQAPMVGDESEVVSSAKQWLMMIQQGQLQVVDTQKALRDATPPIVDIPIVDTPVTGNNEDKDEPIHK